MRTKRNWECHKDKSHTLKTIRTGQRVLDTSFVPLVVKEKEIARREFVVVAGFRAGEGARNEESRVILPLPGWYKKESEYWAGPCVAFQFSTPADAYASNSVDLDRPFGFNKEGDFEAFFHPPTQPFPIWRRAGTIFNR